MWEGFIDIMQAGIFSAAHLCGGSLGGGILLISFALRLALLPLTLRMARRAREQQRKLAGIQVALEQLKLRHAKDPVRLYAETQTLHRAHGIRLVDPSSLVAMLVQAPILAGLFGAVRSGLGQRVRFAWLADLARPSLPLILGVSALSAVGALIVPVPAAQPSATLMTVMVATLFAVFFLWSASSAVALSWASGSLVTILQNMILARDARREALVAS